LDAVLDAEMGDDFDDEEEDDDEEEHCDEDEVDSDNEDDDDDQCPAFATFLHHELADQNVDIDSDCDGDTDDHAMIKRTNDGKKRKLDDESDPVLGTTVIDKGRPQSFSKVDTSLSEEELKRIFPDFWKVRQHIRTVTLKEGEMLFIPTGWFHEVLSEGEQGHIAFNYWFHPPDTNAFHQPYTSDFWKRNFESRKVQKSVSLTSSSSSMGIKRSRK
jgi:hypothetical protein